MNRTSLLLAIVGCMALTACTGDAPTIRLEILTNANPPVDDTLLVELSRPFGHTFATPITATINGVDAGPAHLSPGAEGKTFQEPEVPASAGFVVPVASIGRGVHVELTEGSEHFVVDVPDFNAPREVNVHSSLAALHADDWIEVDSGVATDMLAGGFSVALDNGDCFTNWDTTATANAISFKLPPVGTYQECGAPNAAGSTRDVQLEILLDSTTPVTRCDGPGLTCEPVQAPFVTKTLPATLQF